MLLELNSRIYDELESQTFLALDAKEREFFVEPLRDWKTVAMCFPGARDDIEEAGKCIALERYGGAVFHLMRITEAGALALGNLIAPGDYKPQFSSVLKKIDTLVQKTKWQDWPEAAKPYKPLLVEALPRLYAVKDSWRDKVSHVDTHLVPTSATWNKEQALDIYNSTLSLMRRLSAQLAQGT